MLFRMFFVLSLFLLIRTAAAEMVPIDPKVVEAALEEDKKICARPIDIPAVRDREEKYHQVKLEWLKKRVVEPSAKANAQKSWHVEAAALTNEICASWCDLKPAIPNAERRSRLENLISKGCDDPFLLLSSLSQIELLKGAHVDSDYYEKIWNAWGRKPNPPAAIMMSVALRRVAIRAKNPTSAQELQKCQADAVEVAESMLKENDPVGERLSIRQFWLASINAEQSAIESRLIPGSTVDQIIRRLEQKGQNSSWAQMALLGRLKYMSVYYKRYKSGMLGDFAEDLSSATKLLSAAWEKDHSRPEPALDMIGATYLINNMSLAEPRRWFDSALTTQCDTSEAFRRFSSCISSLPNLSVAFYCLDDLSMIAGNSMRYDTDIPLQSFTVNCEAEHVMQNLPAKYQHLSGPIRKDYALSEQSLQGIQHLFDNYLKKPLTPWAERHEDYLRSCYAASLLWCGHPDLAAPMIQQLGSSLVPEPFERLNVNPDDGKAQKQGAGANGF